MNFNFDELNPAPPILKLSQGEVALSPITLKELTKIEESYGGLAKIFDKIKEKPMTLVDILWELVSDKSFFKYSRKQFQNFFLSADIAGTSKEAYRVLNKAIADSMPLIKNAKRYKELQKIKQSQQEDASGSTCYGAIYDALASRYGYTVEQFYNLTLRQVHILLAKLEDGKYRDLEVQASLMGKKLKPRVTYSDFSEEQEADQDEQALEALKELQKRYQENQNKEAN